MTKNTASIQATYVHWLTNICSLAHEHMFMDKRTYVLRMMMVVLMMMGVCGVWGQDPVATPEISFSKASCQVSITCATDGASIYYRTDGSDPDISAVDGANPTKTYSGAFTINGTTTVKAIATKANYSNSAVQT